ncbi:MAG: hypothetical protein D6730_13370 [Bacteroidetes bacterium]|nr:MAG: hypothetical protein D6730_13370 [Bacteroidota bacterium]
MLQKFIICLGIICLYIPAQAQMYAGRNTLEISSSGTSAETHLKSNQLVASWVFEENSLELRLKTHAIYHFASEADQALLQEVFMIDSNPLLSMRLDLKDLNLAPGSSAGQQLAVPVIIEYASKELAATADFSYEYDAQKEWVRFDLNTTVSAEEMGLWISETYQSRFSDQVNISVKGGEMTRRY